MLVHRKGDIHVVPVNDLQEHVETRVCWCQPKVEQHRQRAVVIHNSLDGRELVERHGLQ